MADDEDMSKVMGFANFGGPKKAKQFDFMAMFEESRKTAMERSAAAGRIMHDSVCICTFELLLWCYWCKKRSLFIYIIQLYSR